MRLGAAKIEFVLCASAMLLVSLVAFTHVASQMDHAGFRRVAAMLGTAELPVQSKASPRASSQTMLAPASRYFQYVRQPQTLGALAASFAVFALLISFAKWRRRGATPDPAQQLEERLSERPGNGGEELLLKRQRIYRAFADECLQSRNPSIHVQDVMSKSVVYVGPGCPRATIEAEMQKRDIHHVMVCDQQQQLVGVISDRDVSSRNGRTASEIMTTEPITVTSNLPLNAAITILVQRRFSCLPVVDGKTLIGILTTADVSIALQCVLSLFGQALSVIHENGRITRTTAGQREIPA